LEVEEAIMAAGTGTMQFGGREVPTRSLLMGLGLLLVLVVVAAVALSRAGRDEGPRAATFSEIVSQPSAFLGRQVNVSGEVAQVLGPQLFTIGGETFAGQRELLVVVRDGVEAGPHRSAAAPLAPGDIVQIEGRVREFQAGELREEKDVTVPPELAARYAGYPVVVGRSVQVTPRVQPRTGGATPAADPAAAPAPAPADPAAPAPEAEPTPIELR
jgi:hypothetical protein